MGTEQTNSQRFNPESGERMPKKVADLLTSDIPGIQLKNLQRLQGINQSLIENGAEGGVLSVLSTTDKSLRVLEKELGIGRHVLAKIYDFYGIPRISQAEASAKALSEARKNPEIAEKMARSASENMKRLHENPEVQEKRIAALTDASRKPDARARRSEIAKNMWQNRSGEDKEEMSRKASEAAYRRWQDPEFRERTVQAIRKAVSERVYTPQVLEKLSQMAREQWNDPLKRQKILDARKEIESDPLRREALRERRRQLLVERKKDPDFEQKTKEGRSHIYDGEKGEALRQKRREQMNTPEARERNRTIMEKLWSDPEFRDKQLQALMEVLADEEYQQRRLAGLKKKWTDPEYHAKKSTQMSQLATRLNSDPEHLRKAAEGIRRLRAKPESTERFALPTIQGYRRDIGYFAQSAWEANVARVLMFQGKQFYPKESFMLEVNAEHQDLFKFGIAQYTVDFIVEEGNGDLVAYEILAHPLEDPVGIAKAEMFAQQYPELRIHIIDGKEYEKLKRQYSAPINESADFCGWETSKDNLRNNPGKYEKI